MNPITTSRTTPAFPVLLMLAASVLLSGCNLARPFLADKAEEQAAQGGLPRMVNHTRSELLFLAAKDRAGEYFSLSTKLSFSIADDGTLSLAPDQEGLIHSSDDSLDRQCTKTGGGANQRTAWFPDTAFFVRGGRLGAVSQSSGAPLDLVKLSSDGQGGVIAQGPGARTPEYFYVPCVGDQRVPSGQRMNGYLPADAVLTLDIAGRRQRLNLALPQPTQPYVLLRYHSGAMIPVPMRPVVVSVDLKLRRLVMQYQTTFAQKPAIRQVELRAVLANGKPAQAESAERYRERTEATLRDLRGCPAPVQPMEPCATPERVPDRLIFKGREEGDS